MGNIVNKNKISAIEPSELIHSGTLTYDQTETTIENTMEPNDKDKDKDKETV